MKDNIQWIKAAKENDLVVGSKARILYADSNGRIEIAKAFNKAIKEENRSSYFGRDHHDVSGTDSPYRETSNIYDGSQFTADMAIQNVIGIALEVLPGLAYTMVVVLVGVKSSTVALAC